MRIQGPLFRKYALVFVAVIGGMLIANGLVDLYFSYRENKAALVRLQREKAAAAAVRIEQFVHEIEGQIAWASHSAFMPEGRVEEQRRFDFLWLLRQVPSITEVSYLDSTGKEQLRVSRLARDEIGSQKDYSAEPQFRQAMTGRTYYGPVYFRKESEPYMTLAMKWRAASAGVTVAELNLKLVWDVVSQIKVGQQGYAYVVDPGGILIAHPDISLVLQKTDLSSLPQVQAALAALRVPDAGRPSVEIGQDLHGGSVLTASAPIAPLGWSVFVEQSVREAFSPLYASMVRTIVLLILGLGLAVVASLILARNMVRPIRALQSGAAQIGAGALDQRIEVRTGDELEGLADQFNQMAAHLQESYAGLERKVEERTRELSEALHQVEEKGRQLAVASQHKSQFLANMSHELRTPLNAILGYTELILDNIYGGVPEKVRDVMVRLERSGRHLLGLINDVLDLSKIEAGQLTLALSDYSLTEIIQTVFTGMEALAAEKKLALKSSLPPDLPLGRGDERRLTQVFLNLLGNAIKFTEVGEVSVQVTTTADAFLVAVTDTGPGIASADQQKIFQEFHQVDSSSTRKKGGTGLGLAIAQRIIALHGGRIWVESSPGQGATFWFTLPIHVKQPTEAP
ncbi:MAG TPA: ATP-binding protein [Candidatus Methylomirabilis sp.]|nr:ATP-binding protein [Candidatus Methylomirabilis sp.]